MKGKDKPQAPAAPERPVCCGRTMVINQRRGRKAGQVIVYRCPKCGTTETVPQ